MAFGKTPNFRVKVRKIGEPWVVVLHPTEARPTITEDEAHAHAATHAQHGYDTLVEEA
jgi:hypothetical protein